MKEVETYCGKWTLTELFNIIEKEDDLPSVKKVYACTSIYVDILRDYNPRLFSGLE